MKLTLPKDTPARKAVVVVFVLFSSLFQNPALGQQSRVDRLLDEGEFQMEKGYWSSAMEHFREVLRETPGHPEANHLLGKCYFQLQRFPEAETCFLRSVESQGGRSPLALFDLGVVQKINGRHSASIESFETLITLHQFTDVDDFPEKERVFARALNEVEGAIWVLEQHGGFECWNMNSPVNSPSNDFGPTLGPSGSLVLSSGRAQGRGAVRNQLEEAFTDNLRFVPQGRLWEQDAEGMGQANGPMNDGPGQFSASGDAFYFTYCGGQEGRCAIWVSRRADGRWHKPEPLDSAINLPGSNSQHPALSSDGGTLYFCSDRPGGLGGKDIWMSRRQGDGWAAPTNLGPSVNTPFDEISPFYYSPKSMLFFSSNGLRGYGGFDIFMASPMGEGFQVENLTSPFNSNGNDAYFFADAQKGFLASDRSGGSGAYDIFGFNSPFSPMSMESLRLRLEMLKAKVDNSSYNTEQQAFQGALDLGDLVGYDQIVSPEDNQRYETLISKRLASFIYGYALPYTQVEASFMDSLTIDDRSLVDMIYLSRAMTLNGAKIDSFRMADQTRHSQLSPDDLRQLKQFEQAFQGKGAEEVVRLPAGLLATYQGQSISERYKFDRLLAFSLSGAARRFSPESDIFGDDLGLRDLVGQGGIISEETYLAYERLMSRSVAERVHRANRGFFASEKALLDQLSIDDLSIMEFELQIRLSKLTPERIDSLKEADRVRFLALPQEQASRVDELAAAALAAPSGQAIALAEPARIFYDSLELVDKTRVDRMVAMRLAHLRRESADETQNWADPLGMGDLTGEGGLFTDAEMLELERLLSPRLAAFLYGIEMPLDQNDQTALDNLSIDKRSLLDFLFRGRTAELNFRVIDSIQGADRERWQNIESKQAQSVERVALLVLETSGAKTIALPADLADECHRMGIDQKYRFDRLVAYRVAHYLSGQEESPTQASLFLPDDIISTQDQENFHQLMLAFLSGLPYETRMARLEADQQAYDRLGADDRGLLEMMLYAEASQLSAGRKLEVKQSAQQAYELAPAAGRALVDQVAKAYSLTPTSAPFVEVPSAAQSHYLGLSLEDKRAFMRMVAHRLDQINRQRLELALAYQDLFEDQLSLRELSGDGGLLSEERYAQFESVISFRVACYLNDLSVPYLREEQEAQLGFSMAEKSLVEMMFAVKTMPFQQPASRQRVRDFDALEFHNLPLPERQLVAKLVNAYLDQLPQRPSYVSLSAADRLAYQQLPIQRRYVIDRVFAAKLRVAVLARQMASSGLAKVGSHDLALLETGLLSNERIMAIKRVLSLRMAGYLHGVNLPCNATDYQLQESLNIDEASLLAMILELKVKTTAPRALDSLRQADLVAYQSASTETLAMANHIARLSRSLGPDKEFVSLSAAYQVQYDALEIEEKYKFDRLVAYAITLNVTAEEAQEMLDRVLKNDDLNVREVGLLAPAEQENYDKITSFRLAEQINDLSISFMPSDQAIFDQMDIEDKSLLEMILVAKTQNIPRNVRDSARMADAQAFAKLSAAEQELVEAMVEAYASAGPSALEAAMARRYAELALPRKQALDRVMAARLAQRLDAARANLSAVALLQADELGLADLGPLVSQQERNQYERVLSFLLACQIYGLKVPMLEPDHQIHQALTLDEASLLDMMLLLKTQKLGPERVDSLRLADWHASSQAPDQTQAWLEAALLAYQQPEAGASFVRLPGDLDQAYRAFSTADKFAFDRMLLLRLWEAAEQAKRQRETPPDAEDIFVREDLGMGDIVEAGLISRQQMDAFQRVISYRFAMAIHGLDMPLLEPDQRLVRQMGMEERSLLEMLVAVKTNELADGQLRAVFQESDSRSFQELDANSRAWVDRLAEALATASPQAESVGLNPVDAARYAELPIERKFTIDRMLAASLRQESFGPDYFLVEDKLFLLDMVEVGVLTQAEYLAYERVVSARMAMRLYGRDLPLLDADQELFDSLGIEGKSFVWMMLESRLHGLTEQDAEAMREADADLVASLPPAQLGLCRAIVSAYQGQPGAAKVRLPADARASYAALSFLSKNRMDRSVMRTLDGAAPAANPGGGVPIVGPAAGAEVFGFKVEPDCSQGSISGRLVGPDGQALANRALRLLGPDGGQLAQTLTDEQGRFVMPGLASGAAHQVWSAAAEAGSHVSELALRCGQASSGGTAQPGPAQWTQAGAQQGATVFFATNSAALGPDARAALDLFLLNWNRAESKVLVRGFADGSGTAQANMVVSQSRAEAVKAYLQAQGWKGELAVEARGSSDPLTENDSEAGRRLNRRAEVLLLD